MLALQQSLNDEMKFDAQDLKNSKKNLTETNSQLATDTTVLTITQDTPAEDTVALADTKQDYQEKAAEFEAATKSPLRSWRRLPRAAACSRRKRVVLNPSATVSTPARCC